MSPGERRRRSNELEAMQRAAVALDILQGRRSATPAQCDELQRQLAEDQEPDAQVIPLRPREGR